jgi:two-component system, NarL family, sensor histidine kinase DesK
MKLKCYVALITVVLLSACRSNNRESNKALSVKDSIESARLSDESDRIQYGQPDSALILQLARKRIDERNGYTPGVMNYYNAASSINCLIKKDLKSGKQYADSAWLFAQQEGHEYLLYKAYYSQGVYYYAQENNDSAIHYFLTALLLQPEKRDTSFYEHIHSYLADIYASEGNFTSALNYYQPLIQRAEYAPNSPNSVVFYTAGYAYAIEVPGKDAVALSYLSAATAIAQRIQYNSLNGALYTFWAGYYSKKKQLDSSNVYAYKAIARINTAPQPFDRIEKAYLVLLDNYIVLGDYKKAQQELIAAKKKIDTASMLKDDKISLLEKEYLITKKVGSIPETLNTLEQLNTLQKENFAAAKTKQLLNHEKELKQLAAENTISQKNLEIRKQQLLSIVMGLISILSLVIVVLIYLYLRKRKHLELIRLQQIQRTAEREKEQALLQFQIEERNRIAHEMHDDLGSTLTTVQMGLALLEQEPSNKDHLSMIDRATEALSNQMNEIIWSLNVRNDHLYSLLDYFSKYAKDFLGNVGIHLQIDAPKLHNDHPVSGIWRRGVYLTLKELLNNIVKYAQAKNVVIRLDVDGSMLQIVVQDDGVGINHSQATLGSKRQGGNGLQNIKQTIEQLKGTIDWKDDKGTETIIHIPIQ